MEYVCRTFIKKAPKGHSDKRSIPKPFLTSRATQARPCVIKYICYNICRSFSQRVPMDTLVLSHQEQTIRNRLQRYRKLARSVEPDDQARQGYLAFKLIIVAPRAERALSRIREGVYHLCEDCADEIGTARLRAVPAATKCLSCQEKSEKT